MDELNSPDYEASLKRRKIRRREAAEESKRRKLDFPSKMKPSEIYEDDSKPELAPILASLLLDCDDDDDDSNDKRMDKDGRISPKHYEVPFCSKLKAVDGMFNLFVE